MGLEKEFANYERSLALKELGFDEECIAFCYDDETTESTGIYYAEEGVFWENFNGDDYNERVLRVSMPLKQQVFRWFREKYDYDISIVKRTPKSYKFEIQKLDSEGDDYFFNDFSFDTYEEAEDACIDKLIELAKNK